MALPYQPWQAWQHHGNKDLSTGRQTRHCIKGSSPAFAPLIKRHRGGAEQNGVIARLRISVGVLLLRNQNYPGSESRARMPALVQIGLDSAYFQTQYTEQPSCGLQARVGPARSGLAFAAPRGRVPNGNGASVPLSLSGTGTLGTMPDTGHKNMARLRSSTMTWHGWAPP